MQVAIFTVRNPDECVYRYRIEFDTMQDEIYPPGGMLRVLRDADGRIVAGPHLDEILDWRVEPAKRPA